MGWMGSIILVALLIILLLILYLHRTFRNKVKYRISDVPDLETLGFTLTLVGLSNSFPTYASPTGFWSEPDAIYAARLAAIRSAQRTVHFETFYITPGRRTQEFAAALIERSLAGVEVLFLGDRFEVSKFLRSTGSSYKQRVLRCVSSTRSTGKLPSTT